VDVEAQVAGMWGWIVRGLAMLAGVAVLAAVAGISAGQPRMALGGHRLDQVSDSAAGLFKAPENGETPVSHEHLKAPAARIRS
jgi:hypothetical protein